MIQYNLPVSDIQDPRVVKLSLPKSPFQQTPSPARVARNHCLRPVPRSEKASIVGIAKEGPGTSIFHQERSVGIWEARILSLLQFRGPGRGQGGTSLPNMYAAPLH